MSVVVGVGTAVSWDSKSLEKSALSCPRTTLKLLFPPSKVEAVRLCCMGSVCFVPCITVLRVIPSRRLSCQATQDGPGPLSDRVVQRATWTRRVGCLPLDLDPLIQYPYATP